MPTFSTAQVSEIISSNSDLETFVGYWSADKPDDQKETAKACAAYLYHTGFLDSMVIPILDSADHPNKSIRRKLQRRELKRQRQRAVDLLQADGIIPSGSMWLLFARWFVLPFLMDLLRNWVYGDGDE